MTRRSCIGALFAGGALIALGGCRTAFGERGNSALANRLNYPARLRDPRSPDPVEIASPVVHDAAARQVLSGARLRLLYDQASWAEGPAWLADENMLIFSDVIGRRVLGWREDGAIDVIQDATPFINGNAVDRLGRIYHCEHGRRAISMSRPGEPLRLLTHTADGIPLNAPNDLAVGADGAIWFSDPTFGLQNPQEGVPAPSDSGRTAICRLEADAGDARRMADMEQPNGVGFSPDFATFYASQTPEDEGQQGIYAFDHDGERLARRRLFARVPEGLPDGFAIDRRGWLWSSSGRGVEVYSPDARHLATIPTPTLASNCAFDAEERRLFVTGDSNLWMIELSS